VRACSMNRLQKSARTLPSPTSGGWGAIYAGFVVVNLVQPQHMGDILFAGLDIAVVYGFGLIVLALVLALVYNRACGRKEAELSGGKGRARP
jgi:uncharacterized membrane protein (DUF485 family)